MGDREMGNLLMGVVGFLVGVTIVGGILWGVYDWTSVLTNLTEQNFKLLIGILLGYALYKRNV